MSATLVNLQNDVMGSDANANALAGVLAQVVGEPIQFVRFSYGDEFTVHFGTLRKPRSRKLPAEKLYGSYIFGFRASPWLWKSAAGPLISSASEIGTGPDAQFGTPISNEELEQSSFFRAGSRVVDVLPFILKQENTIGLQLRTSDAGTFLIIPRTDSQAGSEASTLPEIADWELVTPAGTLEVGPGLTWSFKASAEG